MEPDPTPKQFLVGMVSAALIISVVIVLESILRGTRKLKRVPNTLNVILWIQWALSFLWMTIFLFLSDMNMWWFWLTTTDWLYWIINVFTNSAYYEPTCIFCNRLTSAKFGVLLKIIYSIHALINFSNEIEIIVLKTQCLWILVLVIFYIQHYSHESGDNTDEQQNNTIFSELFLLYIYPLLAKGRRTAIEPDDIPLLPATSSAQNQDTQFSAILNQYMAKGGKNQLLKSIFQRYRLRILKCFSIHSAVILLDMAQSFYIIVITNFLFDESIPYWKGFGYVVYLSFLKVLQAILNAQWRLVQVGLQVNVRAALSTVIYKKSLTSSSVAHTMSDITNLIQVDVQRISDSFAWISVAMLFPAYVLICLALLYWIIGVVGATAASVCTVLFFVFLLVILKMSKEAQKALMEQRDVRMKFWTEFLSFMKILKLYNWEETFAAQIDKERNLEVGHNKRYLKIQLGVNAMAWGMRWYVSVAMLTSMTLAGYELAPGPIFTGLSLLRMLTQFVLFVPDVINSFVQSTISMSRIEKFLKTKDYEKYQQLQEETEGKYSIEAKGLTISWAGCSEPYANAMNIKIRDGEFVAIVGGVGSGKSALIRALSGNMFVKGQIHMNSKLAIVEQEPWIQNLTLRDNVLFGSTYDSKKYDNVLKICELNRDLDILPGGDLTEIGENGINLSGGQKARVALARAIYKDPKIILLDDPLSAVDAHVGKKILKNCLLRHCGDKTRVLVSHGQQYLPYVDRILVMKDGAVIEEGSYAQLTSRESYFAQEYLTGLHQQESTEQETTLDEKKQGSVNQGQLISKEDREYGRVSWSVYKLYFQYAGGWRTAIVGIVGMSMFCITEFFANLLIAQWTGESPKNQSRYQTYFICMVTLFSLSTVIFTIARLAIFWIAGIMASIRIFKQIAISLSNAPINKFYDITPLGRVLNRLSKDQALIDYRLFSSFGTTVANVFRGSLLIIICIYTVPWVVLALPVMFYLGYHIQQTFIQSSREITRLESISKSPILQLCSETISGSHIIRAFAKQHDFQSKSNDYIDVNSRNLIAQGTATAWIELYMGLASIAFMLVCVMVVCGLRGTISASLAGMCMYNVFMINQISFWLAMNISELENCMVSFERGEALTRIPTEAPRTRHKDTILRKKNWPKAGAIEFHNYQMRYRDDTELVLKGIDLEIAAREKVGIVGRTGSGKSSLTLWLFRLIEGYHGTIKIDGVDVSEIGLDLLRQQIWIIPQDPTLFQGTLRYNLDPYNQSTDEQLLESLRDVDFYKPDILDLDIRTSGDNLSVGQKQLICLARALIRKSRIMILDEATASIDYKTDETIQNVIQEKFKEYTVLTVAHRINTILNYDKVVVLVDGKVGEIGTPQELLEKGGLFASFANSH